MVVADDQAHTRQAALASERMKAGQALPSSLPEASSEPEHATPAGGRHPGGPYWKQQDYGSWSVPKGIAEPGEALEAVAAREFAEETGSELVNVARDLGTAPLGLGEVALKSGKVIHVWAVEGDLDPALSSSNEIAIEWPPRTGRRLVIPEVDRVAWFGVDEARQRAHPAQTAFVERLEVQLGSADSRGS
ncbi:MAG: NUDIX domain-containing protein [Candidatus Limnocylindrales bacterium]